MAYESRLLKAPRFKQIADEAQEIENDCNTIVDQLAEYENADELPGEEATELRDDCRDEAISAMERIVEAAARMKVHLDRLDGTLPDEIR